MKIRLTILAIAWPIWSLMATVVPSGDNPDAVEGYQLIQLDSAVLIGPIRPISLYMYAGLAPDQALMLCYVVLVLLVNDLSAWIVVFAREHQIRVQPSPE
jgi:hypothetical protein